MNERPMAELARCPSSGKLIYWKEKLANRAITNARSISEFVIFFGN